jgi:hypothetical protein
MEEQIIQVEFDEELVKEYSDNYIMEEEGIGAEEVGPIYGEQISFNEDSINDLLGEGAEVESVY